MCNFRTKINLSKSKFKINHSHKIITFGSCFAENIAKRLYENKFNAINNPFGILYNPISISQTIERIMNKKTFSENELRNT